MSCYAYKPLIGVPRARVVAIVRRDEDVDARGNPRYEIGWDDAGVMRAARTRGPVPVDLPEIAARVRAGLPAPCRIIRNGHGSITGLELRRDLIDYATQRRAS